VSFEGQREKRGFFWGEGHEFFVELGTLQYVRSKRISRRQKGKKILVARWGQRWGNLKKKKKNITCRLKWGEDLLWCGFLRPKERVGARGGKVVGG